MTKKRQFVSWGNEKKLREGEKLGRKVNLSQLKIKLEKSNLLSYQVRKLPPSLHSEDPQKNIEIIEHLAKENYVSENHISCSLVPEDPMEIIKIVGKAARDGNLSILEQFSEQQDILQSPDLLGRTPLHYGIAFDQEKVVRFLLASGVKLDPCDLLQETPLHYAAANKKYNYCKLLLENGAKMNSSNKNGRTPLHIAARENNLCAIKTMVIYGADAQKRDHIGYNPLQLACLEGALPAAKMFLEILKTNSDKLNSENLLHLAVKSGNSDLVEYLLDQGLDINALNDSQKTPLHLAFLYFSFQRTYKRWLIIKLLLNRNADYTIKDQAGKIPTDYFH